MREHALAIWNAGVAAARPADLVRRAWFDPSFPLASALAGAGRILVVGAGKASAAMAESVENLIGDDVSRVRGIVNVPAESVRRLRGIKLHAARPAGTNQPTAAGVEGSHRILELFGNAGPQDVGVCLISGGGSALLPAPVEGVPLEDKQEITRVLHACGASINEMNTVRKHLSRIKGGRLAQGFTGRELYSLIISDVIGDPLDVIASGPTAADPTTFAEALAVLEKYAIRSQTPGTVLDHLERGAAGLVAETPKTMSTKVNNRIIGNNAIALAAAQKRAEEFGFRVLHLGSSVEGETRDVAVRMAAMVRSILNDGVPEPPPICLLSGGETTVTLGPHHGLGGRNQEFVLATLVQLAATDLSRVVILSGGTDGEDGPTDAAGAVADGDTVRRAADRGIDPMAFLLQHDAYHFFEAVDGLIKTRLTHTNVMDVRVILIR